MNMICTNCLTDSQAGQLAGLVRLCQEAEPITLSCPLDGNMFCLLTEGGDLVGALAVFYLNNMWECYAFTRPDRRRQGAFTRLLERLEAEALALDTEPELCFITDGNSPGALKTLEALGAEFWYAEHAMVWECPAGPGEKPGETPSAALHPCPAHCVHLEMASDSPQPSLFTARDLEGTAVGRFSLYIRGNSASLFQVEVPEPLRGLGWGTAIIRALLDKLPAMGVSRLILQVSGSNAPAISLYKKTGFRIRETLSYYLY